MILVEGLLVAGATFRRLANLRNGLLAVGGGLVIGLLARAVPSPELVPDLFTGLAATLVALLGLPALAGLPTGDRRRGYEALQGLRPLSSVAWVAGRMVGGLVAVALLALVIVGAGRLAVAGRPMPRLVTGRLEDSQHAPDDDGRVTRAVWRFALPAGCQGPFDLSLQTWLPLAGSGELERTTRRGRGEQRQTVALHPARRHRVVVPDLSPERGDLYVTLRPGDGVVLGGAAPELTVGSEPLGLAGLVLPRPVVARLAFALLATLAAACAFHFETACLAGLLALARVPPNAGAWGLLVGLLLLFAVAGTALTRRQAMP